jgi:hypothetical protein
MNSAIEKRRSPSRGTVNGEGANPFCVINFYGYSTYILSWYVAIWDDCKGFDLPPASDYTVWSQFVVWGPTQKFRALTCFHGQIKDESRGALLTQFKEDPSGSLVDWLNLKCRFYWWKLCTDGVVSRLLPKEELFWHNSKRIQVGH